MTVMVGLGARRDGLRVCLPQVQFSCFIAKAKQLVRAVDAMKGLSDTLLLTVSSTGNLAVAVETGKLQMRTFFPGPPTSATLSSAAAVVVEAAVAVSLKKLLNVLHMVVASPQRVDGFVIEGTAPTLHSCTRPRPWPRLPCGRVGSLVNVSPLGRICRGCVCVCVCEHTRSKWPVCPSCFRCPARVSHGRCVYVVGQITPSCYTPSWQTMQAL